MADMDNAKRNREPRQEVDQPVGSTETVIHAVARTVGATFGTITLGAAKVLGGSRADRAPTEERVKSQAHASSASAASVNKRSEKKMDRRKRKKTRHKRTLKRSNTKG